LASLRTTTAGEAAAEPARATTARVSKKRILN
jgi:hypothetical protein